MKKIYILIIAAASVLKAVSQSAPGPAPGSFNSCDASNCTPANGAGCPPGSPNTTIAFFDKQYVNNTGQANNQNATGAVWKFYNVANDNSNAAALLQVNATITIESAYLAEVIDVDNNNAQDENGNNTATMRNLFSPTISADRLLTSGNRAGYVQFRIRFYKNNVAGAANKWDTKNYTDPVQLSNLNYVHYDIDGVSADGRNGYQLRETGLLNTSETPAGVAANANTELNAYSYTGDGANWRGYMGSVCNRDNTSQCSQVVASFALRGAYSSVAFRMGYSYSGSGNGLNDDDVQHRLYASTFGCFTFPQPIILPVKLLSFAGRYSSNTSLLNWETESEVNFDHYEIERSVNGSDFTYTGSVTAQEGNSTKQYHFTDNLVPVTGNLFYYRLKMVNHDGRFTYSQVLFIRRNEESSDDLRVMPNPVSGGSATISFSAPVKGRADIRVIDLSGKIVLQQQSYLLPGPNNISINGINFLRPGMYAIQVVQSNRTGTAKLSILP